MRRMLIRVGAGLLAFNLAMAAIGLILRLLMRSHGDEESDELALAAVMNGIELRNRSAAFRGGTARAIMGGIELDLRGAALDPAGARLDLLAVMGGVQLIVPDDWRVHIRAGRAIMGGFDGPRLDAARTGDAPTLQVGAPAVMGGIEVMVRPRAGADLMPAS
jgi:hypothetical protein